MIKKTERRAEGYSKFNLILFQNHRKKPLLAFSYRRRYI